MNDKIKGILQIAAFVGFFLFWIFISAVNKDIGFKEALIPLIIIIVLFVIIAKTDSK